MERRRRPRLRCSVPCLVLAAAGDDYFEWLESLRRQASGTVRAKPPPPPVRQRFAVPIAESGSPRSRRILVVAADPDDTHARALAEVGRGWAVLAIEPARE